MLTCGVAGWEEMYDSGDANGGEAKIEGEVLVLDRNIGPGVVLSL